MSPVDLIQLPTNTLLEKFGSGTHAPGSGSAAALMGMLSARLIVTVTKLSLRKAEYQRDHAKIEFIAQKITSELEPSLRDLFQRDATIFDEVIKARVARDAASDEKERRKHGDVALEKLKTATDIPFQIGDACLALIDHGAAVFDMYENRVRHDTARFQSVSRFGHAPWFFAAARLLRPVAYRSGRCVSSCRRLTSADFFAVRRFVRFIQPAPNPALKRTAFGRRLALR